MAFKEIGVLFPKKDRNQNDFLSGKLDMKQLNEALADVNEEHRDEPLITVFKFKSGKGYKIFMATPKD